jgi:large subunit GTPase 1
MWADHFESQGIAYAFFSAADAAAAQEQAEKQRRREEGTYDEAEEVSEDEVEEELSEEDESEEEPELSKAVEQTTLEDEEEGWSTEGEDDGEEGSDLGEIEEKLAKGKHVPLAEVAREVAVQSSNQQEATRTRVLSVTELEDLFQSAAPDLSGRSEYSGYDHS